MNNDAVLGGQVKFPRGSLVLGGEAGKKREKEAREQAFLALIESDSDPQAAIASPEGRKILRELIDEINKRYKRGFGNFLIASDRIDLVKEDKDGKYWRVNWTENNRFQCYYAGRLYLEEAQYLPCRCEKRFRDRTCKELLELIIKGKFLKQERIKSIERLDFYLYYINGGLSSIETTLKWQGTVMDDGRSLPEKLQYSISGLRANIAGARSLIKEIKG